MEIENVLKSIGVLEIPKNTNMLGRRDKLNAREVPGIPQQLGFLRREDSIFRSQDDVSFGLPQNADAECDLRTPLGDARIGGRGA